MLRELNLEVASLKETLTQNEIWIRLRMLGAVDVRNSFFRRTWRFAERCAVLSSLLLDDWVGCEDGVWYGDGVTVARLYDRCSDADLDDSALVGLDLYLISDLEHLISLNQYAGDEVLDDVAHSEAYGDAEGPQAHNDGSQVNADEGDDYEEPYGVDDVLGRTSHALLDLLWERRLLEDLLKDL